MTRRKFLKSASECSKAFQDLSNAADKAVQALSDAGFKGNESGMPFRVELLVFSPPFGVQTTMKRLNK